MSGKAATSDYSDQNKAKEQRKPRSSRQAKEVTDAFDNKKKEEPSETKFNSKEIENDWNQYGTKLETYEEFEKKQNMGADYEELSKVPFSSGNHFQFKHEKINYEDVSTQYDRHFQLNIDILTTSLLSLPFVKRNSLDMSAFRPGELKNMIHRSNQYAEKTRTLVKKNIESIINANANSLPHNGPAEATDRISTETLLNAVTSEGEGDPSDISESVLPDDEATLSSNSEVVQQTEIIKDFSTKEIDLMASSIKENDPVPTVKSADDLEKWLDDFLDGS